MTLWLFSLFGWWEERKDENIKKKIYSLCIIENNREYDQ